MSSGVEHCGYPTKCFHLMLELDNFVLDQNLWVAKISQGWNLPVVNLFCGETSDDKNILWRIFCGKSYINHLLDRKNRYLWQKQSAQNPVKKFLQKKKYTCRIVRTSPGVRTSLKKIGLLSFPHLRCLWWNASGPGWMGQAFEIYLQVKVICWSHRKLILKHVFGL